MKKCTRMDDNRIHCNAFSEGYCLNEATCDEVMDAISPYMIGVPTQKSDRGKRFNSNKRPTHLAPRDVRAEVDWNYAHGANKYGENDWQKGQPYSESKACLMRHLDYFESGQEIDPETGLNHLAAAITNLEMMLWHHWHTWPTRPELDDRPKKFNKTALVKPSEREPNQEEAPF